MLIKKHLNAPGPLFVATAAEQAILGGMLLSFLQYWHENPITSEAAWNTLTDWLEETDFRPLITVFTEEPWQERYSVCSDGQQPKFVGSVTEQDASTALQSERRWPPCSRAQPTPTRAP